MSMKFPLLLFKLLTLLILLSAASPGRAHGENSGKSLRGLDRLAASVKAGVAVVEIESGDMIFGNRASEPLIPASVMKVATAAAALEHLGPNYRFITEVLYDNLAEGRVGTLYIRGGGDPSLTIEELWKLIRQIYKSGVYTIDSVVLDDSRFNGSRGRVGQRAYETGSSALALSFNSIGFDICPSRPGFSARVVSDPWEAGVKLQGTIRTIAKGAGVFTIDEIRGAGGQLSYRLGGTIGAFRRCETIYRSVGDPAQFFGKVFNRLAGSLGIKVRALPKSGTTPGNGTKMFEHRSKALSLVLEDMNHYSTNFIAEQVLFALGQDGETFSRERGLERLRAYVSKYPEGAGAVIQDGSGLSHDNRLSSALVATIVRRAAKDPQSGVEFLKSLSVGGGNGTLKQRFGPETLVRGKTGTLTGVSSLAGVVRSQSGKDLAFSILLNGPLPKDDALDLEDSLVQEIYSSF